MNVDFSIFHVKITHTFSSTHTKKKMFQITAARDPQNTPLHFSIVQSIECGLIFVLFQRVWG